MCRKKVMNQECCREKRAIENGSAVDVEGDDDERTERKLEQGLVAGWGSGGRWPAMSGAAKL